MSVTIMAQVFAAGESLNLTDKQYLVLLALADAANDEGIAWPGRKRLGAKANGASPSTVSNTMALLEKRGIVSRDINNAPFGGETNTYRIDLTKLSPPSTAVEPPFYDGRTPPSTAVEPPPSTAVEPNHNIEPSLNHQSMSEVIFDTLASQYGIVDQGMVGWNTELAEKYGLEAWLRGWQRSKPQARHNPKYVEKAIVSNLTDDEIPEELKAKEPPRRTFYMHTTDRIASGYVWVEKGILHYEAKDGTTYKSDHQMWVARVEEGNVNDAFLSILHMRGNEK